MFTVGTSFPSGGPRRRDSVNRLEEAIIDGDLLATPPDPIRDLSIWMTVVDGAIAYRG